MEFYESLLDAIGRTPLLNMSRLGKDLDCTLLGKLEMFNPGGSVKDRIGIRMIESAEREGLLKPGGTIVEPTSGNTGVGLAIAAVLKGYRCIFTMPDKMSQEKIDLLRSYGAEVVITPTAVPPDSPESYYSVANRLTEETSGAFQPNQYHNMNNPEAHYHSTGPEIWEQTDGRVTHLVVGVGTGGTVTGCGRYLKEQNPDVQVIGADPVGSVLTGGEPAPYLVEGIGKESVPDTLDPSIIDRWVRVSDRDSFLTARRITAEEGLLSGGSAGTAVWAALEVGKDLGPDDVMVVIIPDSGRNYLSKLYDAAWMRQNGFIERPGVEARIDAVMKEKRSMGKEVPDLVAIALGEKVGRAIDLLQQFGISQVPVATTERPSSTDEIVGSIHERLLLDRVFRDPEATDRTVNEVMEEPLPVVQLSAGVDAMFRDLSKGAEAIVVADGSRPTGVLTRADLLEFLAAQSR
ncbi:MAG: cystathionine beta-synthase [Actinomycetota bacterium]